MKKERIAIYTGVSRAGCIKKGTSVLRSEAGRKGVLVNSLCKSLRLEHA